MSSDESNEKTKSEKRTNLMSIINTLKPDASTTESESSLPPATTSNFVPGSSSSMSDSPIANTPVNEALPNFPDFSPQATVFGQSPDVLNSSQVEGNEEGPDVMTNILRLLYQAASSNTQDDVTPPENDESILEMQHPPEGKKSGFKQLIMNYANATETVQGILANEINIIYECKRCRGMFRSLPNLIRHKKEFCKNTGLMSTILNRASNSSKEEDAAFQLVLNALHPPEPEIATVPVFGGNLGRLSQENIARYSIDGMTKNFLNFSGNRGEESSENPTPSPSTSTSSTTVGATASVPRLSSSSQSSFGKFYVGRTSGNVHSTSTIAKPYPCPICKKQMAERKSVRRHLLGVHSVSVVDAYKLMNYVGNKTTKSTVSVRNSNTTTTIAKPAPGTRSRPSEPGENLLNQCVENIKLGPNRIINVLPETFPLSSVQCPVCRRELCRRTNVRRHLLEAHNLIIKGEKKYFQLKDIARNTTSSSPTLRRLRHLFTVTNRGLKNEDKVSMVPVNSKTSSSVSLKIQTSAPGNSLSLMSTRNSTANAQKQLLAILPKSASKENKESTAAARALKLEKLKFVESTSPTDRETSTALPNSSKVNTRSTVNGSFEDESDQNSQRDSEDEYSGRSGMLRRQEHKEMQAMKSHALSFHGCKEEASEDDLEEEATFTARTSGEDDTQDEEPPPKKLRQLAPLGAFIGKATPVSNSLNGTVIATAPQVISQGSGLPITLSNGTLRKMGGSRSSMKNLVVQKVPSDGTPTPVTSANGTRTFIKVELRNPIAAKGGDSTSAQKDAKACSFDFGKLTCYTCDKKFLSAPDMKRHLLGVHSFSTEEALAACYDCSNVTPEAQKAGVENGFDITHAKCLLCKRFYFSRENLWKHLTRSHHMEARILEDLKSFCSINPDETTEQNDEEGENFESSNQCDLESPVDALQTSTTVHVEEQPSNPYAVGYIASIADKCTEEQAAEALRCFPKENINVATLRCLKCKNARHQKAWDLKVHLLKHLGLGFYMCNFCPKTPGRMACGRGSEMIKHLQDAHGMRIKKRENTLQQCRVNYQHLWEAYDLPQGKQP